MAENLMKQVRRRARERCEYCQMPQAAYRERFQIDHIIARQHGGSSQLGNLALCCLRRNCSKGPNLTGIDPAGGQIIPLFHPRKQRWPEHFRWEGPQLVGITPTGRATVAVLAINHPDRVLVRQALIDEGLFPVE